MALLGRSSRVVRPWLGRAAIVAVVYFAAAKFGLSLASETRQVTAVFPPTGIALAALLLFGPRVWPGVFLGAFAANATSSEAVATAMGIAVGDTAAALVGWYGLSTYSRSTRRLDAPATGMRWSPSRR